MIIPAAIAIESAVSLIPSIISGVTVLLKSKSDKKASLESRVEHLEVNVEELGKNLLQLSAAMQVAANAFEASETDRQALARKVKGLSIALGIVSAVAIGAVAAALLR